MGAGPRSPGALVWKAVWSHTCLAVGSVTRLRSTKEYSLKADRAMKYGPTLTGWHFNIFKHVSPANWKNRVRFPEVKCDQIDSVQRWGPPAAQVRQWLWPSTGRKAGRGSTPPLLIPTTTGLLPMGSQRGTSTCLNDLVIILVVPLTLMEGFDFNISVFSLRIVSAFDIKGRLWFECVSQKFMYCE